MRRAVYDMLVNFRHALGVGRAEAELQLAKQRAVNDSLSADYPKLTRAARKAERRMRRRRLHPLARLPGMTADDVRTVRNQRKRRRRGAR